MKQLFGFTALSLFLLTIHINTFAQLRKIPAEVTDTFSDKYPGAKEVEWKDKLTSFAASFTMDDIAYLAYFNTRGVWQSTEQEVTESDLPDVVKDSYSKSKYADWTIENVHKIQLPDEEVRYRVEVASGDIKKRNLYFNSKGRLLKDNLTL